MSDTVISILYVLTHLSLKTTLKLESHESKHPHFSDEEMEAQRSQVTHLRSHSSTVAVLACLAPAKAPLTENLRHTSMAKTKGQGFESFLEGKTHSTVGFLPGWGLKASGWNTSWRG